MSRKRSSSRGVVRAVGAVVMAVLLLGVTACGDDGDDGADAGADASQTSTTADAAAAEDALGTPNAATGEPVVVGLLTTGGECASCSEGSAQEEPAAVATVAWMNEYLGGIAGRPVELKTCNNDLDPSKAIDCANELISAGAVAVVTGADSTVTGWETLHAAGIPVISFATTEASYTKDPDSTFVLNDGASLTVEFPIGVAKELDTKDVSIVVIDLPAATDIYASAPAKAAFKEAGLDPQMVPAPLGAVDMTPQAQQIVKENPDGVVNIVGHDAFCIPTINGLLATGFTGTIATISYCVTDAMREALGSTGVLEGMRLGATDALGDASDPSTQQFNAVMEKYAKEDVLRISTAAGIFSSFAALAIGTAGLEGEVAPASIITAMRSMDNAVLPGTGGRQFRCNGKASASGPAICSSSGLSATLDAEGRPVKYVTFNDKPIPD